MRFQLSRSISNHSLVLHQTHPRPFNDASEHTTKPTERARNVKTRAIVNFSLNNRKLDSHSSVQTEPTILLS
ncbi:hypothetical protein F511_24622 [Dorcoceras hygrometricum]|uniref:Uncharacterized protein n=1 Tax=Dorcoceras hygrometricum TaxID=472368 RepID=A0A2Z7C6E2_9LAMI|nr:hypothetical protein F511_24622 [Dorcoceras hygrometricum]